MQFTLREATDVEPESPRAADPKAEYCCHLAKQWTLTRELGFAIEVSDIDY